MNIDKRALKGVVDEIEASRARQKGETEFQREALKRAVKQHNLDAKAIRIVLQRRAMGDTKRDEQDYFVHSYELALGGKKAAMEALEQGASVREAAKAGGISTGAAGNLAKTVQKSSFVDADGVIAEPAERADNEAASGSATGDQDATGRSPGEGEDDERSRAGDADGGGADRKPAAAQRDTGGESRGDEPVRRDASLSAGLPDPRDGRGCGLAAAEGTRQVAGDSRPNAESGLGNGETTAPAHEIGAVAQPSAERVARNNLAENPIPNFLRRQKVTA